MSGEVAAGCCSSRCDVSMHGTVCRASSAPHVPIPVAKCKLFPTNSPKKRCATAPTPAMHLDARFVCFRYVCMRLN